MREIKFRAWWKEAELMEEVMTLSEDAVSILVPLKPNSLGQKYEHQTLEEGQYELMQFTGLHDKNGKEIWEGDLVMLDGSREPKEMKFERGAFMLDSIYGGAEAYRMEVIGNIYENPDLLK